MPAWAAARRNGCAPTFSPPSPVIRCRRRRTVCSKSSRPARSDRDDSGGDRAARRTRTVAEAEALLLKASHRLAAADAPYPARSRPDRLAGSAGDARRVAVGGRGSIAARSPGWWGGRDAVGRRARGRGAGACRPSLARGSPKPSCCAAKGGGEAPNRRRTSAGCASRTSRASRLDFADFFSCRAERARLLLYTVHERDAAR